MSASDYHPQPINTSAVKLEADLVSLTERLAENAHELWAEERLKQGWKRGPERNDGLKEHPGLVPYADLEESEKEFDRKAAMGTLKAILALGGSVQTKDDLVASALNAAAPEIDPAAMPAGWEKHLKEALNRNEELRKSPPPGPELDLNFDMNDGEEIKFLKEAGATRAAAVLESLDGALKQAWHKADADALWQQTQHRVVAALAICFGISAILLAILQLGLKCLDKTPAALGWIAKVETGAVCIALLAILFGLITHRHHSWLASRQQAERLRILKFQSLSWPELWCDQPAWQNRLEREIREVQGTDGKRAHAWANEEDEVRPDLSPGPDCVVPSRDILALAAYYQVKRLKFQQAYFTRQSGKATRQSWIAKYKLSLVFFLLSVGAVAAHNLLHVSSGSHQEPAAAVVVAPGPATSGHAAHLPPAESAGQEVPLSDHTAHLSAPKVNPWEVAAISLAALLPVLGFGFRAWLAAFEASRSRNLYTAKAHAIEAYLKSSKADSSSVEKILHHIAHGEHFLTGEHREWCRLQLEAEWFA